MGRRDELAYTVLPYRGYKIVMDAFILKTFGATPISEISYLDVEEFIADLDCSAKRINNLYNQKCQQGHRSAPGDVV